MSKGENKNPHEELARLRDASNASSEANARRDAEIRSLRDIFRSAALGAQSTFLLSGNFSLQEVLKKRFREMDRQARNPPLVLDEFHLDSKWRLGYRCVVALDGDRNKPQTDYEPVPDEEHMANCEYLFDKLLEVGNWCGTHNVNLNDVLLNAAQELSGELSFPHLSEISEPQKSRKEFLLRWMIVEQVRCGNGTRTEALATLSETRGQFELGSSIAPVEDRILQAAGLVPKVVPQEKVPTPNNRGVNESSNVEVPDQRKGASTAEKKGDVHIFRCQNDTWQFQWLGGDLISGVKNSKGFKDIRCLLSQPGVPVPLRNLPGNIREPRHTISQDEARDADLGAVCSEVGDPQEVQTYRNLVQEQQAVLDEPSTSAVKKEEAKEAIELAKKHLKSISGLSGRPRTQAPREVGTNKRRISRALEMVATKDIGLWKHLSDHIKYDKQTSTWQYTAKIAWDTADKI